MENKTKNVADFYNKTATEWNEEFFKDKKESEILKKFYKCFSNAGTKSPRILDIGSGAGYDSKILNDFGAKTLGIDISEKLVEIAKKNVPYAKFVVGDITKSLDELGAFDGIICLATLIHIDVQKMKQTFNNMSSILKKGGLLLISVQDGVSKNIEDSIEKIDGVDYDKDLNYYSAEELCGFAYPKLKLIDTWKFKDYEEGWRYYIFIKQ